MVKNPLTSEPKREKSGSTTLKKYHYQYHWAFCRLLDEHCEKKEYPIFVTAGSSFDKLTHIMHNKYLAYCYETLSSIEGSLICYGFGFGQYDDHIIKAINKAGKKRKDKNGNWHTLNSIYIGIYSKDDLVHIKQIEKQFKVPVRLFDAKTVMIWE